jgi:hypothetical protein
MLLLQGATKEYIERRLTEPVKVIFLLEMGLLSRRASTSKKTIFLKILFKVSKSRKKYGTLDSSKKGMLG